MIVLDTHAWLWLLIEPQRLSVRARTMAAEEALAVCTISAQEVAMLVRRGRLTLDRDVRTWVQAALAPQSIAELAPSAATAARAGLLENPFPGDPADRLIYATAVGRDTQLITADRAIRAYDPARCVW